MLYLFRVECIEAVCFEEVSDFIICNRWALCRATLSSAGTWLFGVFVDFWSLSFMRLRCEIVGS